MQLLKKIDQSHTMALRERNVSIFFSRTGSGLHSPTKQNRSGREPTLPALGRDKFDLNRHISRIRPEHFLNGQNMAEPHQIGIQRQA